MPLNSRQEIDQFLDRIMPTIRTDTGLTIAQTSTLREKLEDAVGGTMMIDFDVSLPKTALDAGMVSLGLDPDNLPTSMAALLATFYKGRKLKLRFKPADGRIDVLRQ